MYKITFFEQGNNKNASSIEIEDISMLKLEEIRELEKEKGRAEIRIRKLYPVTCCWCGVVMGYNDLEGTQGVCPDCAKSLTDEQIRGE